ncbi:efflux transporter outer membrane subunit [Desulfobacula sp.]
MGCAVGPSFETPAPPGVTAYTSTPLKTNLDFQPDPEGQGQKIIWEKKLQREWWQGLGSEQLNILVSKALAQNPTLTAAKATLRQANELYTARAGSTLYPQAEASLGGQRQRFNPQTLGQTGDAREFDLYNASVGVRYTFDPAGGNRSALEALAAKSDYRRFELEGARLTLETTIVTTVITQASLSMQIETMESILKSQREQLELTQESVRLGQKSPDVVAVLQTQLEQNRADLPLVRNRLEQNNHLLAVLTGQAPGAGIQPSFSLQDFTLPSELPLIVPSELVRARPDISGAEALLKAANAEYKVAVANLYPQLNLSADLGSQALTFGSLFDGGSAVWSLVGQLTQPLFTPGLPAEKRAALAAFDAAAANYRWVVLESFRNMADVLRSLENDAERLVALRTADKASRLSLELTRNRYGLGAADYTDLLIASQQRQQTQLDLIEARAKRLLNSVAFYQAIGGGI